MQRQFDEFAGTLDQLNTQEDPLHSNFNYYTWREELYAPGVAPNFIQHLKQNGDSEFATNVEGQHVLDALAAGREIISWCAHAPHDPVTPPPPNNQPPGKTYVGGATHEEKAREYFMHLDWWLGQVIPLAVSLGYVVFFDGDNGTSGEGKGTFYEVGLNTPLFVWTNGITPHTIDRLVSATDYFATIRELRGESIPVGAAVDSFSFADELGIGFIGSPSRNYLTCDDSTTLGEAPDPANWTRMIRNQRYKLIRTISAGVQSDEFYDLDADPNEQKNLYGSLTQDQLIVWTRLVSKLQHVP